MGGGIVYLGVVTVNRYGNRHDQLRTRDQQELGLDWRGLFISPGLNLFCKGCSIQAGFNTGQAFVVQMPVRLFVSQMGRFVRGYIIKGIVGVEKIGNKAVSVA